MAIVKKILRLDIPVNDRGRLLVQDFQDVQELANQVVDFSGSELVVLQVLVEAGRSDIFFNDGQAVTFFQADDLGNCSVQLG